MMLFRSTKSAQPCGYGPYGAACWLCQRIDDGTGFPGNGRDETVWSCKDHHDGALYKKARNMSRQEFEGVERTALIEAGKDAGAYLDSIGKTDLAQLEKYEWAEFLKIVVRRFGDHVTVLLRDCPF